MSCSEILIVNQFAICNLQFELLGQELIEFIKMANETEMIIDWIELKKWNVNK